MEFWSTYLRESLYQPWIIQPEASLSSESSQDQEEALSVPGQPSLFIAELGLTQEGQQMMQRMLAALHLTESQVMVISLDEGHLHQVKSWGVKKRVLFFGDMWPGVYGEWSNWSGHQIFKTHGIHSLLQNPELKRETWMHLKIFAGA